MLAGDLFERLNLILEAVHLLLDIALLELVTFLEEFVDLLNVILLGSLQDLKGRVLLAGLSGCTLTAGFRLLLHVIDLFVNLNLRLGLEGVEEFLLLGVLFQFVNVAVETSARPEAGTKTQQRHLVHVHEVKGSLHCPHLIIYIIIIIIIEAREG